MESLFTFFAELPTYYYYIGGIILLIVLYQRYDENHRYNQKSGPAPESEKPGTFTEPAPAITPSSTASTQIVLNQQMINFLKSYDASKDSWTNWAIKKMFPLEIIQELHEAAEKGELKEGMKIKIEDGRWEEVM